MYRSLEIPWLIYHRARVKTNLINHDSGSDDMYAPLPSYSFWAHCALPIGQKKIRTQS